MGKGVKHTTETFIKRAREIYGSMYDYSKVNYINAKTKVEIICPIHGPFWQRPNDHLSGYGCFTCGYEKLSNILRSTKEQFIEKARTIHRDMYDYSKVNYINNKTKVEIICPEHGSFYQNPETHIRGEGHGCPKCGSIQNSLSSRLTLEEYIKKAREIHGNRYDYSKVKYKGGREIIEIICPEHGSFWQQADIHIYNNCGCPVCNASKGENIIKVLLDKLSIHYLSEYRFKDCKYKKPLPFDFYLPDYNICIEFDGVQHFENIKFFKSSTLEETQYRDQIKTNYCKENNIRLIRISYTDIDKIEDILSIYFNR